MCSLPSSGGAAIERYIDWLEDKGANLGMPMSRIIDKQNRIYE